MEAPSSEQGEGPHLAYHFPGRRLLAVRGRNHQRRSGSAFPASGVDGRHREVVALLET